ncbi:MAG: hypothetical protein AAFY20_15190 [Cyanobacteria bacterium J06639_14]
MPYGNDTLRVIGIMCVQAERVEALVFSIDDALGGCGSTYPGGAMCGSAQ